MKMIVSEEMKSVIEGSPFLSLVTMNPDGTPHPIVVGKASVDGENVLLGIYKMEVTQRNLALRSDLWLVAATKDGGPKGYRITGTAKNSDKQLILHVLSAEALI